MYEHTPVSVRDFRGRYNRGDVESVPTQFFSDEGNLIFSREGFESRRGFAAVPGLNPTNVLRVHEYRRIGEASRYIYLTSTGDFFDSVNPSSPILSIVAASDFAMVVMFNRAYISPHDRVTGITSQKLYVYDGSGTARVAAGNAPSGFTLVVTEGAATGSDQIEKGIHLFAIAFETSSGFITKPGLTGVEFKRLDATGGKEVNISGIPVGPAGTTARHILTTKILPEYQDGTQSFQEWFFLPSGKISDNTTTVLNNVKFFDVALQDSADRLLDQLSEIPAGVFLVDYESRLCVGGEAANKSTIRVSDPALPESFSAVDGFCNVNPGDAGGGVSNGVAHRGSLYISKAQRFYATNASAGAPSAWPIISVDSGIGTECFGISSVLDSRGHSRDQFLVAARSGLYQYLGAFNERELTWNIKDDWARINQLYFNKVQVCVDPQREWILVAVPLDSATECSHVLYGDYSEALDPEGIKWSIWNMPKPPTCALVKVDDATKKTKLVFGSSQNGLYQYDDTTRNDFGTMINAFYETTLFEPEGSAGQINHFAGFRQRIRGSGALSIQVANYDRTVTENYTGFSLSAAPGREILTRLDFLAERASVRCTLVSIDQYFSVNRYSMFCRPQWTERPE